MSIELRDIDYQMIYIDDYLHGKKGIQIQFYKFLLLHKYDNLIGCKEYLSADSNRQLPVNPKRTACYD